VTEPLAWNEFNGEYTTRLQYEASVAQLETKTIAHDERKHRFESANPSHFVGLRARMAAMGEALDRGDVQAMRHTHQEMQAYLNSIDPSAQNETDEIEDEESLEAQGLTGTTRESEAEAQAQAQAGVEAPPRNPRRKPQGVPHPWPEGESQPSYEQRTRRKMHEMAALVRYYTRETT
jgi:hypothetical protein